MARSRSRQGRKQYSPQDWEAEVERQKAAAAQRRAADAGAQQAQAPAQPAPKPAAAPRPAPAAAPQTGPSRPGVEQQLARRKVVTRDADATHVRIPRFGGRGKLVAAGFAGGAAVGSGGTYAALRHQQRKNAMSKSLVNPFEEVVVLGKRYPVALPVPGATTIRALVPTGGHVGHANDLVRATGRRGAGGRATKLERYRGRGGLARVGPFGKAAGFGGAASRQFAAGVSKPSVKNGLRMVTDMPKLTKLPTALQRPKVNSNIPTGAKRGSSLSRA